MRIAKVLIVMLFIVLIASGCKKDTVLKAFVVDVGENSITTTAEFTDKFALNMAGTYEIYVKEQQYGTIFAEAATENSPFKLGATVDFTAFTGEVWEGYEPAYTLPNGDPIPGWIQPNELVHVDIPEMHQFFDIHAYVGYKNPYYLGIAVTLDIFDENYPDGLTVTQTFKTGTDPWGSVTVFGPAYDSENNIIVHGGIFFVAKVYEMETSLLSYNGKDEGLMKSEVIISGPAAAKYKKNKKELKKALKLLEKRVSEFNKLTDI